MDHGTGSASAPWTRSALNALRGREPYFLALLLVSVASSAGIILHHADKFSLYDFGDALSHIIKAREYTDGPTPNLKLYIGTTWLPLPHLLLLPFASVDALFFSGIAGMFVGIPCLAGTGVLLFLIVKDATGSSWIAFLMAAVFGLNPNVVYMALTPMDEMSLIFLVTLTGYCLFRWLRSGSLRMLLLTAVAAIGASLCRYEAWTLPPVILLAALIQALPLWRSSKRAAAIRILAAAALSVAGIAFWVAWHFIAFNNPLKFAQGTYSALADYYRQSDQRLPSNILRTYWRALVDIFGPMLIVTAAIAIVPIRKHRERRTIFFLLVLFAAPFLFTLSATLAGYVGVDKWWWNWRYVLSFGTFLAVAGGIGIAWLPSNIAGRTARFLAAAGLCAMPFVQLFVPAVSVATYMDAAKCVSPTIRDAMEFGGRLHDRYRQGSIALLTEESSADRIKIGSGIPNRIYRSMSFPAGYRVPDSLLSGDSYAVMEKNNAREPWTIPQNSPSLPDYYPAHFRTVIEDSCFIFLERISGDTF